MFSLKEFEQTRAALRDKVQVTPLLFSDALSARTGQQVYLKAENFQRTHSFKIRAAYGGLLAKLAEARQHGVVTGSSGNFAQAIAYVGQELGVRVTVVMLERSAPNKVEAARRYGAEIVFCENDFAVRTATVERLSREQGKVIVPSFDGEGTIRGNGTLGFELLEQLPAAEVVLVPVSGGGLVAGVSAVLKQSGWRGRIYGVQPEVNPSLKVSLERGEPTLPAGTRVLEVFVTARGVAYVDLSKEAATPTGRGSDDELITVYSVVNSLTSNFPAVKRVQIVIEAMLQSPYFLYRVELSPAGTRLSGYELASRLSLLLRNTTPDDALLDAAAGGQLDSEQGLVAVATQMLSNTAATEVLEAFHTELFGLHRYGSILKNTTLFPTYSEALNETLLQADQLFFQHVFENGGGLRAILTSNVAYVNQATAGFYGISAPSAELMQVTLDGSRPGFLTRLGFLAYNATLRDPDPIHRGVDINNRILCNTLEPPAGEIPPLPEFVPGQTNRERVEAHTGEGFCGGCHAQIINPLGFALEGFDAMGQARSTDNGKPVNTTGEYAFSDGVKTFTGIADLAALLGESQQAHGCYAANLSEYALARDLAGGDAELVSELQEMSLEQDLSIKDVLTKMVQSSLFVNAKGGTP